MVRMTLESRVIHPCDLRMLLQKVREPHRAFVLMAHAHRQCLHSAMEQETCMRIERSAEVPEFTIDPFDQFRASDDRAGDDVGMSIEVFRATMERKVETQFSGPE